MTLPIRYWRSKTYWMCHLIIGCPATPSLRCIALSFRPMHDPAFIGWIQTAERCPLKVSICTGALLLGAAFLMLKRYITWHIPVTFIATVGILTWIFGGKEGLMTGDPILHMMSGGLILGAFFMATDYVTGPSVRNAQIVFGVACGILTALIRLKGGYPEGVMFAILLMNCFAPLLDRGMRSAVFGKAEAKGVKK